MVVGVPTVMYICSNAVKKTCERRMWSRLLGIKFRCPHCGKDSCAEVKPFRFDGFYCANCGKRSIIERRSLWSGLHAAVGALAAIAVAFLFDGVFFKDWPILV